MTYFAIGIIFGILIFLASVVICLGELLFWVIHYIKHEKKPRLFYWSKFNRSLSKHLETRNYRTHPEEYFSL